MKKIISMIMLLSLCTSFMYGCTNSSDKDKIILFLANVHESGYPTSVGCDEFARLVKEKTDGRIIIETYHDGQLGEESETIKQVEVGGIDFARVSISPLAKFDDNLNALQLPYLYNDEEHMWKVLNGQIGEDFLNSDNLKQRGILGLTWFDGGSRNFYNTKKEVQSPDDLKGMKIRVQSSNLMMGLVSSMGAEPTPIAFEDVYSSLEKGNIDGAENNWPSYISTKHYEIAKYITVDKHTTIPEMIIASTKSLEKLSKEDVEIIKECAKESTQYQIKAWNEYEEKAINTAKEAGCTITYLDDNGIKKFQSAVEELNNTEGEKYSALINKIKQVK